MATAKKTKSKPKASSKKVPAKTKSSTKAAKAVKKSVKKISQLNFDRAMESNKPVGPEPLILKLNLFFIRKYKYHLPIQINIANFLKCWS